MEARLAKSERSWIYRISFSSSIRLGSIKHFEASSWRHLADTRNACLARAADSERPSQAQRLRPLTPGRPRPSRAGRSYTRKTRLHRVPISTKADNKRAKPALATRPETSGAESKHEFSLTCLRHDDWLLPLNARNANSSRSTKLRRLGVSISALQSAARTGSNFRRDEEDLPQSADGSRASLLGEMSTLHKRRFQRASDLIR